MILKKEKDLLLCSSYRPISLLNVDLKILSKVLALRLQQVLPSIISQDQTGFMLGRHSYHNTRRLLNIIHSASSATPEIVVALDAEKAFDRVEWEYLYDIMGKFGFSRDFISWIRLLYSPPTASLLTNHMLSPSFPLKRGTRQGCPLSPLLFAIAIEPLAIWLRSEQNFVGITRQSTLHKVSLYADDLLLYISDPAKSIPKILEILEQFGTYSGYKLNLQKSELLPINTLAKQLPHTLVPFKWVDHTIHYLGISITTSMSTMFRANFQPLMAKTEKDFDRWSVLPLSLMARINLVKMVTLPKFLYCFQHIPILLNKSFFDKLDTIISRFLWGKNIARIRKATIL